MYALILVPFGTFILGGMLGYLAGRYQSKLLDKIRTLETPKEPEETPAVTGGVLRPPKAYLPEPDDDSPVGLVESKTPQRVEFETVQAIENEGRGIRPPK